MNVSIIPFPVINSTNIYTTGLLSQSGISEWTVVMADSQTGGKGQRGKTWDSEFGKNILCSIAVFPEHLRIHEQFLLSAAASLALCKTLSSLGIEAQIKWPNDIMVKGKKIAGILIENQLSEQNIDSSVIGVGLNVNQVDFNTGYPWPATSIKAQLRAKDDINREEVLFDFLKNLHFFLERSKFSKTSIQSAYNERLMLRGNRVSYTYRDTQVQGLLRGVTLLGELVIRSEDSEMKFVNGEVRLLNTFSE